MPKILCDRGTHARSIEEAEEWMEIQNVELFKIVGTGKDTAISSLILVVDFRDIVVAQNRLEQLDHLSSSCFGEDD